jgi:hypothetical protein
MIERVLRITACALWNPLVHFDTKFAGPSLTPKQHAE